ncbi:hypothetical protein DFH28DRAFT_927385 [Melampsora americana]|nr:hypothetical protein DFH28DRAFT_927385 [Melampsora americana]
MFNLLIQTNCSWNRLGYGIFNLNLEASEARRQDWRKSLSSALNAYCRLITAVQQRKVMLLRLEKMRKPAANWPQCFGPPAPDTKAQDYEPDFVVCCDGTFQERRHLAASVPIPEFNSGTPELFIEPAKVEAMAEVICGSCPRKDNEPVRKQFAKEREAGCLKSRTSVFHTFVHERLCQLHYNPRLNRGWGLLDGKRLERIWLFLLPLVSPLQYSTSKHWLESLSLQALHLNDQIAME